MFTEIKNPPRPLTKPAKGPQTSNPIPNQKRLSADASPHLESKDLRSELAEVKKTAQTKENVFCPQITESGLAGLITLLLV